MFSISYPIFTQGKALPQRRQHKRAAVTRIPGRRNNSAVLLLTSAYSEIPPFTLTESYRLSSVTVKFKSRSISIRSSPPSFFQNTFYYISQMDFPDDILPIFYGRNTLYPNHPIYPSIHRAESQAGIRCCPQIQNLRR